MSLIAITMGCPASIGPEIILRYFHTLKRDNLNAVVLGDPGVLVKCGRELNIPAPLSAWQPGDEIKPDTIPVLELSQLEDHQWGSPSIDTSHAMVRYITKGVQLINEKHIDGITTCPIAKDALKMGGYTFPGHTEMLADLTGCTNFSMMMAGSTLKVTLATIHCSLKSVPGQINREDLIRLIRLTAASLKRDFGIAHPRVAVAALNPHAGESCMFGDEDQKIILPAVEAAQSNEFEILGPFPPDTVFFQAVQGNYDCVVCMYHDQGLIPFKLIHFKDGVNVTIGLPIIRTSVDHGTAYDIAGKGVADAESLASAVTMAHHININRRASN